MWKNNFSRWYTGISVYSLRACTHPIRCQSCHSWPCQSPYRGLWLTGQILWRGVVSECQAGLYYRGPYLIRPTAGKVPALKVQFPLWHNTAIEVDGDRIVPLAEFEIEMLKSKQGGNRNDWILCFFGAWKQKKPVKKHQSCLSVWTISYVWCIHLQSTT